MSKKNSSDQWAGSTQNQLKKSHQKIQNIWYKNADSLPIKKKKIKTELTWPSFSLAAHIVVYHENLIILKLETHSRYDKYG